MKIGLLVNAFARTKELDACLASVVGASKGVNVIPLVVHQIGVKESIAVSKKYRELVKIKYVEPHSNNPLACINHNRYLGLECLFDDHGVDAVLSVEDDVEISRDSALFCAFAIDKYWGNPDFRGVNLGSRIPKTSESKVRNSFSLVRYGLHGQAGLLTSTSWKYIKKYNLGLGALDGFDAQIESYLKTGFMVTSNYSRYLDRGFDSFATHAPKNSEDPAFTLTKNSYIGRDYMVSSVPYSLIQMDHTCWRRDAVMYRRIDKLKYWVKHELA